jgi:glycosyltransferase involved in cell wall biosynthesis
MKICFFAKVSDRQILETVRFYADDIQILRELGHEVVIATSFAEVPFDCDLYFVWWWTWAFLPLAKAFLARKPMVITGVFNYETPPKGFRTSYVERPFWQQILLQLALRSVRANVFISEFERQQVMAKLAVRNPVFLPLSIDVQKYKPLPGAAKSNLLSIAWSGQVNALRKCLPQIIEAFARVAPLHPEVRLVMAGRQGEYHPELVVLAQRLGVSDRIDFLGVISEEDKIRLMQTCAVYMQPTLFEGFGQAQAEAMACGAAVVSSPVGAVPEVVGQTGLLVPPDDIAGIADAVNRLLNDPVLAARLGEQASARVAERFHFGVRKRGLEVLIAQVMRQPLALNSERGI